MSHIWRPRPRMNADTINESTGAPIAATLDPVRVEIIRNALLACAEEMKIDLRRTSYSPIINEMNDFAVGIFTADGQTIAQAPGLPEFVCDIPSAIVSIANDIGGFDKFEAGDVYLTNDPYANTFHVHDVNAIQPFFWNGRLVGFTGARAHWHDIGGAAAAATMTATEVFQEGVIYPSVALYRRGVLNESVMRIIGANTRLTDMVLGDLRAQVGACHVGVERILAVISKYGIDEYDQSVRRVLDDGERQALEALREIPDGVYFAETALDNDGIDLDVPLPIRVQVTKEHDRLVIDLTGSAGSVRGSVNANQNTTRSICRLAFKQLTTPTEPANEGHFRMVDLVVPSDSIFNARRPSATWPGFFALESLQDAIKRALAPAVPDRVNAEEYGRCTPAHLIFWDAVHGYRMLADTEGGGWGAKPFEDGENGMLFGEIRIIPVEILEMRYPVRLRRYTLRENSGGPGRFRGGLGVIKEYECLEDCTLNAGFDRQVRPPEGVLGGHRAMGNRVVVIGLDGARRVLPSKVTDYPITKGEIVSFETGGGGGYGDPRERDLDLVRTDLTRHNITSPEQLEEEYGVVLHTGTIDIDQAATTAKRLADPIAATLG
jgi:N-methylhydantoinase B